jgi:hypothetical protein
MLSTSMITAWTALPVYTQTATSAQASPRHTTPALAQSSARTARELLCLVLPESL